MAPTRFTSGALITRNNIDALDGGFPRPRPSMSPRGGVLVWAKRQKKSPESAGAFKVDHEESLERAECSRPTLLSYRRVAMTIRLSLQWGNQP